MKLWPLSLALLCGCAIEKFNQPPTWASTVATHARFFGLNASIPMGSTSIVKVQLGWGSETWTVIPVSTNKVFIPSISDTFKLGQDLNPFQTTITEDLQSGYEGPPPPARFGQLFSGGTKLKPAVTNAP